MDDNGSELVLMPCPFCKSDEVALWYKRARYGRISFVECEICGGRSKAFSYYGTGDEVDINDQGAKRAVAAWNRRG